MPTSMCKHLHHSQASEPNTGGPDDPIGDPLCRLKEGSEAKATEIFERLFGLGLERAFNPGTDCPLAARGAFTLCPYFEAASEENLAPDH